jgi:hypothetical protein
MFSQVTERGHFGVVLFARLIAMQRADNVRTETSRAGSSEAERFLIDGELDSKGG